MKFLMFVTIGALVFSAAFSQKTATINVPDFTDAKAKAFYTAYANHLIRCIDAIRKKDENKAQALFKDPGEKLVEDEKIISAEVIKYPTEKKKYIDFATQVYPYLNEIESSGYYKKMYGNKKRA